MDIVDKVKGKSWRAAVLSIASVIIGLLIGPVIEAIAAPLFQPSNLLYIIFIIVSLMFIVVMVFSMATFDKMNSISQQVGVTYIPVGKGNTKEIYKQVIRLCQQAKSELLILNYHLLRQLEDEVSYDQDAKASEDRRKYYETLIEELNKRDPKKYKYRRIIQIAKDKEISNISDPVLMEHLKILSEKGKQRPEYASLKKCPIFFESTYIISDRQQMFWQVTAFDPDEQEYVTEGFFLFNDPTGEIISHFVNLFERYDAKATLVTNNDLDH